MMDRPGGDPNPRLVAIWEARGRLRCLTGCHVGAGRDVLEIGGIDNPVVRDPVTRRPYIPGSSLKGKFRSLLEAVDGKGVNGQPCSCAQPTCRVCRYFGPHRQPRHRLNPTRFLFRDAMMSDEAVELLRPLWDELGLAYSEAKYEIPLTDAPSSPNIRASWNGSRRGPPLILC